MTTANRPDPSTAAPAVEMDLDARLLSDVVGAAPVPTPALLRWNPADPFAVELEFLKPATTGVTWLFGWELPAAVVGGAFCAGSGDVRIWRSERAFTLVLQSPDGSARFWIDPHDLAAFVITVGARQARAADAVVWPGTVDELIRLAVGEDAS